MNPVEAPCGTQAATATNTAAAPHALVESALVAAAFGQLRLSVLMSIAVALLFMVPLWPYFPAAQMKVWLAALMGTSLARLWLWYGFVKAAPEPEDMQRWRGLFWVGAVAAGLAWATGPMLMMSAANGVGMALLSATLLSVCAVGVNSLAGQPLAMQSFLVAALAPTALSAGMHGDDAEFMLAMVLFAGLGSLIIAGRRSSQAMRMLLQTQAELSIAVARADSARDQAQAASQAKTRFLANMSHELRTPLNAVIGAAQLLRSEGEASTRDAHLVDAIQRSGTNLLGLIENILDLSRIEAGEMPLHTADFHLVECVEGALTTAALAANAKGLRLSCYVDPELPAWRHGDAARLRQLVLNLLGNAVKFTERGEVQVRVAAGDSPRMIRIDINDTGVGIDEASLKDIFNPFRQAEEGANRRYGGSGLGLAIVRQLTQAMGGDVHVTSTPGVGSCFTLDLPLPLAATPPAEPAPLAHFVAYVEPHDASALALQANLQRMGCHVTRCTSAEELRQWVLAAGPGARPWVLLAADEAQTMGFIDRVIDLVEPDQLVGMTGSVAQVLESGLDGQHLSRKLVKPITRSALVSRFGHVPGAPRNGRQAVASRSSMKGGPKANVLVVEDDELNRAIVTGLLKHAGYSVSVAPGGREALASVAAPNAFDLVLLDWQMPGMDGLEVCRRLRAGDAGPVGLSIPIVALTANAFAEDRAACLSAGMDDFLTKPVLAANLMTTVERWTAGRATTAAEAATHPTPNAAPGAATKPAPAGPFDPNVLAALPMVLDGSEPEYAQELLIQFLDSLGPTIKRVEQLIQEPDLKTLQRLMHTLKSTSASMGATELAEWAATMEASLRAGEAPRQELPQQLRACGARLAGAIASHDSETKIAAPVTH